MSHTMSHNEAAPVTDSVAHKLQPHQVRVLEERSELDAKLAKLRAFIHSPGAELKVDCFELYRLRKQADHMQAYSDILGERIAAFPA